MKLNNHLHEPMNEDEGPFVSFTDLLAGVLFIFLVLIATLMLLQKNNIDRVTETALTMAANDVVELKHQMIELEKQKSELERTNSAFEKSVAYYSNKLQAINSKEDNYPSIRLVVVANKYSRSITNNQRELSFQNTSYFYMNDLHTIVMSESRNEAGDYSWQKAAVKIPKKSDLPATPNFDTCLSISAERITDTIKCNDGMSAVNVLRVSSDRYHGYEWQILNGRKYEWEIEYQILKTYDQYLDQ